MRKFLIALFVLTLVAQSAAFAGETVFLENSACFSRTGFNLKETSPSASLSENFRRIETFPVLLNVFHKIPNSFSLNEFSISCDFTLGYKGSAEQDYELYLPGIGEGIDIYFNGKRLINRLVIKNGRLADYYYTKFLSVKLPARMIQANNRITFHIAGYAPISPLSKNFLLGLPFRSGYSIAPSQGGGGSHSSYLFLFFLNASYIFFGIYHLFFYLRWRVVKYNLYFAFFTFSISGYFMAFSQPAFENINNAKILVMLSYLCQPAALALFTLFLQSYFYPGIRLSRFARALPWTNFVFIAGILPGREEFFQPILMSWYLLAGIHTAYLFVFLYRIYREKLKDSHLLVFSVALALVFIFWDILDTVLFFTSVRLGQFAYFLVVISLVLILANRFIETQLETEKLNRDLLSERNSFSRFVPTQFLKVLGHTSGTEIRRGDSSEREMAVLFSDIRNFTGISENLSAGDTFKLLNIFMRRMEICIKRRHGFIDKYIGDGILALFEAEENGGTHQAAVNSVKCAIEMYENLRSLNEHRVVSAIEINMGIGIHIGKLVLGTVGSPARLDTTVIGDTVNLSSRLEQLTVRYGSAILISDSVEELIRPAELPTRELDTVQVKGKSRPVTIFEVLDADTKENREKKISHLKDFSKALQLYRTGNFSEAAIAFNDIFRQNPLDLPARHMARRCAKLHNSTLIKDWNGILVLNRK